MTTFDNYLIEEKHYSPSITFSKNRPITPSESNVRSLDIKVNNLKELQIGDLLRLKRLSEEASPATYEYYNAIPKETGIVCKINKVNKDRDYILVNEVSQDNEISSLYAIYQLEIDNNFFEVYKIDPFCRYWGSSSKRYC